MITPMSDMKLIDKMLGSIPTIAQQPDAMRVAMKRVGVRGLAMAQRSFNDSSRSGHDNQTGNAWPKLSPVTVMFRRGAKVASWGDIDAKRAKIQPLRDTGELARSLTASGGMVAETSTSVVFGSRLTDNRAKVQEGFSSQFDFDKKKRDDFFKRVMVKESNPRDRYRTPAGNKRSKPLKAKVWSAFAWNAWRGVSGMDGKTYKVPPRPFFSLDKLKDDEFEHMIQPVIQLVERSWNKQKSDIYNG